MSPSLLPLVLLFVAFANAALAQTGKQAYRGETYGDWVVGCDNGGTCTALSLNEAGVIDVSRTGESDAEPQVTVLALLPTVPAARTTTLVVDGRTVGSVTGDVDSQDRNVPVNRTGIIAALASGRVVEVLMDERVTARLSLHGSAAAFRYRRATGSCRNEHGTRRAWPETLEHDTDTATRAADPGCAGD